MLLFMAVFRRLVQGVLVLHSLFDVALGADNGVARLPPMGYNQWNFFHNNFNASLFLETSKFMKEQGFLDAGYNYMTLGGIGYANGSTCQPVSACNITRNATGFLQVDPKRFPGGNEGFTTMVDQIRALGYKWGSYTEAGTSGCNGAKGSSEGYEEQDAKLFVDEWKSEYLMVDSCGIEQRPPPHGPPPNFVGGQARWELTKWKQLLSTAEKPVLLHDCHNGCASGFGGPTLYAAACDTQGDPSQRWLLRTDGSYTAIISATNGLCAGCGNDPLSLDGRGEDACANTAAPDPGRDSTRLNASYPGARLGLGMGACQTGPPNGAGGGKLPLNGVGKLQVFNYSKATGYITSSATRGPTPGQCLTFVSVIPGSGAQVVLPVNDMACNTSWDATTIANDPDGAVNLRLRAGSISGGDGKCLAYSADIVAPNDEWCIENNNMWRSSTDTLQVWDRIMTEVESVATQGHISRPGAWSFPDAMELGTPGGGVLTWEESKSNLALFAVSSSPLFLGNDPREGRMQARLVELLLNKDMLEINQQYSSEAAFAGGRIKSTYPTSELWAKPLVKPKHGAAVVLFNRGGMVYGESTGQPIQPHCSDPESTLGPCVGCFIDQDKSALAPCNDNVTSTTPPIKMTLAFSDISPSWLGLMTRTPIGQKVACDVFDVYGCPAAGCGTDGAAKGVALGRFTESWSAMVPSHGVRFLRLSGCSSIARAIDR